MTVGSAHRCVKISGLEYVDHAALLDSDVHQASNRLQAICHGSRKNAAMEISLPKTKAMLIHKKDRQWKKKSQTLDFRTRVQAAHGSFPQSVAWLYTKAAGATEVILFAD